MIQALTADQRHKAVLQSDKLDDYNLAETFAMFLRSPSGYLFELLTLEAFDRMDWIYYPREEQP